MYRLIVTVLCLLLGCSCKGASNEIAPSSALVAYNTKSGKYHCPSCRWAVRCTRNCIEISAEEAVNRGGISCSGCGGRCQ